MCVCLNTTNSSPPQSVFVSIIIEVCAVTPLNTTMGCKTSKTKTGQNDADDSRGQKGNQPRKTTTEDDDAAGFLNVANVEKHPVARRLLSEWVVFLDAQEQKVTGDERAALAYELRPKELWADTSDPVSHKSVDRVGKLFLAYIGEDLAQRGWGGKFNYQVKGVAEQGFLHACASVEPVGYSAQDPVNWDIKVRYTCQ